MPKNSTKNQQKRPGNLPGSIFALICTRVRVPASRVCAPARALVTRANQEARARYERKTPSASATCDGFQHMPTGVSSLRAINASKEKNPGLLIFKKNILNLDL